MPLVVDFHAHFVAPEVMEFAYKHSRYAQMHAQGGAPQATVPAPQMERMLNPALRLKEMDEMGIDIQVISPSILQQCTYFAEPEVALTYERMSNDHAATLVAQHPDRLVGLGSLPMQDTALAVQELERVVRDLKLHGVVIGSEVNGLQLGDPILRPFWRKVAELGTTVFIHPQGNPDPKMVKHKQMISLGQPLEEAFAMSSLVYEGVMDECPGVKIAIAHGGGYLPFYTGRHDHLYRSGLAGGHLKGDFSSYLPTFHYDTVLFNVDMLEYLAVRVPVSNIMLATDFPFGEKNPVGFVKKARIGQAEQNAILGANAAAFLGLKI